MLLDALPIIHYTYCACLLVAAARSRQDLSEAKMLTQFPLLARLGIYRISSEKQETLIKLMILSICGILCKLRAKCCHVTLSIYLLSAFSTRLFAVLRFESVIHEFDP